MIVQNGEIFATRAEARVAVERGARGIARLERRFHDPSVTVLAPESALLVSAGSVAFTLDDGREINSRFTVSLLFRPARRSLAGHPRPLLHPARIDVRDRVITAWAQSGFGVSLQL
ncbi:MAG: hypothetical protein HC875_37880, partial [Anaerolineales bacterium]|nr:hypothetical protein [Anaerolineales bacterium]